MSGARSHSSSFASSSRNFPSRPPVKQYVRKLQRKRNDSVVSSQSRRPPDSQQHPHPLPRPPLKPPHCNLDRFLESTCPAVRPQYLPKSCQWEACQRRQQLGDADSLPFFVLGDLWDRYGEWSAFGAGVPIAIGRGQEMVVQYYVPYLSALQLYTRSGKRPSVKSSRLGAYSDASESDFRDSSSEASSDCDSDRLPECWNCECGKAVRREAVSCCFCDQVANEQGNVEDDNSHRAEEWNGRLLFEFFEETRPHARVPIADKIAELARGFPELAYIRSVDLLAASWMSVAWYPIYRIPTGPTLRDLEACFLTFHCLSTSLQDGTPAGIKQPKRSPSACSVVFSTEKESSWINLEAFGVAHYKLRGSIWTSVGNPERKHASSLYRCAESWLRQLNVHHPDFEFFRSHNPSAH